MCRLRLLLSAQIKTWLERAATTAIGAKQGLLPRTCAIGRALRIIPLAASWCVWTNRVVRRASRRSRPRTSRAPVLFSACGRKALPPRGLGREHLSPCDPLGAQRAGMRVHNLFVMAHITV